MTHEEARVEEVKRVMENEENEPLYIRAKLMSPMVSISNYNFISNDVDLAPKYLSNQEQANLHFEDKFRLLGTKILQACHRR